MILGREILNVLGAVSGTSNPTSGQHDYSLAKREALLSMLPEAKQLGANAVVGAKLSTGSYEQQGSKWMQAHHTLPELPFVYSGGDEHQRKRLFDEILSSA